MARASSDSTPYVFTIEDAPPRRSAWERFTANRPLVGVASVYALALVVSAVLAIKGHVEVGAVGCLLVLTMGPLSVLLVLRRDGPIQNNEQVEEIARVLHEINSRATLSDDAVRVLNRHNERTVLIKAIEEDIAAGDWEPAMVLVRELADRCGYRVDAEEFRKRIDRSRSETVDREVHDALASLEGLIAERRWDVALADAGRISRLYPESARVQGLKERVEHARATYRTELEREFLVSAKEGHAARALEILKEFDFYLTPEEAAPYQELVRGVVTKARENLGAEFKLAVQDRNWREAAEVGERVIAEFPNSRMAAEIREMIDQIRERAARQSETRA